MKASIRKVLMAKVTWGFFVIFFSYWVIAWAIPLKVLIEILDGVVLASCVVTLGVYLPISSKQLMNHRLDRTGRLLLGITLTWMCTLCLRGLAMYGRSFGRPTFIIESAVFGLILWGIVWSAALHISAPFADDIQVKPPYTKWALIIGASGIAIATFFLGVQYGLWLSQGSLVTSTSG